MAWRRIGLGLVVAAALTAAAVAFGVASGSHRKQRRVAVRPVRPAGVAKHAPPARAAPAAPVAPASRPVVRAPVPITVGSVVLHLVDPTRTMHVGGGTGPRSFDTIVRYPIGLAGPFPLIVFGHGYAVTPGPYSRLLDAWTRAGYVVAAPIFPLENANAPGGPNEQDLVNQPQDMSLVISSLMAPDTPEAARLKGMINFAEVAVSGQSDGGDTALAAAYDPSVRDARVKAAVILSGAEDPFARSFTVRAPGPPLLAVQGTADTVNPPSLTDAFFTTAPAPKYLLRLIGAGHLPPYTQPGPELTMVEHMTLAFLNRYLKGRSPGLARYVRNGSAGAGSVLISDP